MARLLSEDEECPSSLEIEAGGRTQLQEQTWQHFTLNLVSGAQKLSLGNTASVEETEGCMLCLAPENELGKLITMLEDLTQQRKERLLFEPAEPSFELEIVRTGTGGFKVNTWMDSGNAKTGIYRWDATGIRFFTTQAHLVSFLEQLKHEFPARIADYGSLLMPPKEELVMSQVQTMISIVLPDGSSRSVEAGSTCADLAKSISQGLARKAVGATINGELRDLHTNLHDGDSVRLLTPQDSESVELLRHSTAHVMAEAVQKIFPQAKIAIGPTIQDGFYYDFDIPDHTLTPDDLILIEAEMKKIAEAQQRIERFPIPDVEKQLSEFKAQGEKFKAELLEQHRNDSPTLYLMKDKDGKVIWNDLCRGPHLPSTGSVKFFKLLKVSGSYWRGDEKRDHLQRIYATAFWSKDDLDEYLHRLEEAEKRDHRKLSKQLDLFSVHEEVGPGLIFWHPHLATIRNTIEDFWRTEHRRRGYQFVFTPHIASEELYKISGHLESYSENMYAPMDIDGMPYRAKPMNCPGHIMIYKSRLRSYRDLPLRFAELGTVYRYERSGVLHGMLRVRGFTQDDSHIFCTPEQLESEIEGIIDLIDMMMKTFGYTYKAYLSTRPEKSLGTDEEWALATGALENAMKKRGMNYEVDEGGGVFYAPKIDIKLYDAIGREWQGPTVQVDLNLPSRFDVNFIGPDGNKQKVIMVHRAVLGSLERFCGGLIEHYAGVFPTWLAPTQVVVLPIADRHNEAAAKLLAKLKAKDLRAEIDARSETIKYRIREAQVQQIPYMLLIGDKEASEDVVAVRHRRNGDMGSMSFEDFLKNLETEIASKQ